MANTNLKFDKAAFKKEVEANVKILYRKTSKDRLLHVHGIPYG